MVLRSGKVTESNSDDAVETLSTDGNVDNTLPNLEVSETMPQLSADQYFQLELKKLELEKEKEVKMLELEIRRREIEKNEKIRDGENGHRPLTRERDRRAFERGSQTNSDSNVNTQVETSIKVPQLTANDNIDVYLRTFEQIAQTSNWDESSWVVRLASSLTGKARGAYIALPEEHFKNYRKLKEAIFKRYELNGEIYRMKFRSSYPKQQESYTEWGTRLTNLFDRWLEMEKVQTKFNLAELVIREQIYNVLPKELCLWIKDRQSNSIKAVTELADEYIINRGGKRPSSDSKYNPSRSQDSNYPNSKHDQGVRSTGGTNVVRNSASKFNGSCYKCNKCGNKAADCHNTPAKVAYRCRDYHDKVPGNMYESIGSVDGRRALILRDTGCSHTLVSKRLVFPESYTGRIVRINGVYSSQDLPVARIYVKCSYFSGYIDAGVHENLDKDVLLGNEIGLAWENSISVMKHKSKHEFGEALIVTRKQQKKLEQEEKEELVDVRNSGIKSKEISSDYIDNTVSGENKETRNNNNDSTVRDNDINVANHGSACLGEETLGNHDSNVSEVNGLPTDPKVLIKLQEEARTLSGIRDRVVEGDEIDSSRSCFFKRNGLLYRKWSSRYKQDKIFEQIVVPKSCRLAILQLAHDIPLAGHLGTEKTKDRVLQNFNWPGIFSDIGQYCKSCPDCQKTARSRFANRAPLIPLPTIDIPFKRIGCDILGPLPRAKAGNRYLLVICDYATRFPEAIPIKNQETKTIVDQLITVFSRVGIPEEIITDQGTNFMSILTKQLCQELKISHLKCTAYSKGSNGLVERFNGTFRQMLRKYAREEPLTWDQYIPYLLFAYREVPQQSTGFSPFELLYGRPVRGPLSIAKEIYTGELGESPSVVSYIVEMRDRMKSMMELANNNLVEAQEIQKTWYDQAARQRSFNVGDKVLLLPTSSGKLEASWHGPYTVTRRLNEVNYEIDVGIKRKRLRTFHVNLLKLWVERKECLLTELVQSSEDVVCAGDINFKPQLVQTQGWEQVTICSDLS
ncbi:uncharacterized protein LOC144453240 [Glandiceps talaboti]